MALSMGIAACVRPAAASLVPLRPPQSLCCLKSFVLVLVTLGIATLIVFGCTYLLVKQPWYVGGTGQGDDVSPSAPLPFFWPCCGLTSHPAQKLLTFRLNAIT